ncbi:MAG: hypothetical protein Q7O66_20970 [Dehalococcoidia bacterium]|nr:hypothetical protein [Dehalococcoidia bacterium]
MAKTMVKLFQDPAAAARAITELVFSGAKLADIGVAVKSPVACDTLSREAGVSFTARVDAPTSGTIALSGPAAGGNTFESLAAIWDVAKEGLFYYESGLQRGGVVVSVQADEAGAASARAILRSADSFHVAPTDPPTNDGPFYLSERVTRIDQRGR